MLPNLGPCNASPTVHGHDNHCGTTRLTGKVEKSMCHPVRLRCGVGWRGGENEHEEFKVTAARESVSWRTIMSFDDGDAHVREG
jgi:hypothetical protein